MRVLIQTEEFLAYYNDLPENIKCKFDHAMNVLRDVVVPNSKFVKRLVDTDFYELRVSVATNEYRTIIFAIDNENIVNATQILLLNAFLKKSTKDYKKQIKIAENILETEGNLVIKAFQGPEYKRLLDSIKYDFRKVKSTKPPSSRQRSKEMYIVGLGYRKGPKKKK